MLYPPLGLINEFNLGVLHMLNIRYFLFLLVAMNFYQANFGAAAHGQAKLIDVPLHTISLGNSPYLTLDAKDAVTRLQLLGQAKAVETVSLLQVVVKRKTAQAVSFKFVPVLVRPHSCLAPCKRVRRAATPAMTIGNVGHTVLSARSARPESASTITYIASAASKTPHAPANS